MQATKVRLLESTVALFKMYPRPPPWAALMGRSPRSWEEEKEAAELAPLRGRLERVAARLAL